MNERLLPRWALWLLEVGMLVLLCVSWIGGWLTTRGNLLAQPPGSRRVTLEFWSSSDRLWFVPVAVAVTLILLVLRHRNPIISFVAGSLVVLVYSVLFPIVLVSEIGSILALLLLTFWALLQARFIALIAAASLAVGALSYYPLFGVQQNLADSGIVNNPKLTGLTELLGRLVMIAIAITAALLVRRLRTQAGELEERNAELVQRRGEAAKAAVVDERLRISRELHDVVAHHITTMTVHAGGAQRALTSNVDAAQSSLEQIAASGRDAIGDLQRMLGFLRGQGEDRESDDARSPSPSLRHLTLLTASFGDDLDVTLEVVGSVEEVPVSVDLSAYRIVQEALTNVAKHSDAKAATVSVEVFDKKTTVRVMNPGAAGRTGKSGIKQGAASGTGHGLIGMQERVALHAGTLEAGPTDEGGWLMVAVLRHGDT